MRKGERRARPTPRAAAELAFARWSHRYSLYGRGAVADLPQAEFEAAMAYYRRTWHAAVRWTRQDERRRRGESRMAVLLKGRAQ